MSGPGAVAICGGPGDRRRSTVSGTGGAGQLERGRSGSAEMAAAAVGAGFGGGIRRRWSPDLAAAAQARCCTSSGWAAALCRSMGLRAIGRAVRRLGFGSGSGDSATNGSLIWSGAMVLQCSRVIA
jgi:hypothetical protein